MRNGWLLVMLLCCLPAFADKNRREAEKLVSGIQDSFNRMGLVQQSSAGRRDDMNCTVQWTENILVTDTLGCKVTLQQTGSNVQTCVKDGTNEKLIVSNEWENKIHFDLGTLNSSAVVLKERKNETLNDFPSTTAGKIYELSFTTKRQEGAISWSSRLKYVNRNSKSFESGDVRTDHQEGVWNRFAFIVRDEAQGHHIGQAFSQAMDLCSSQKK